MGLLDQAKGSQVEPVVEAESSKKKSNSEYQKKRRAELLANAKLIRDVLKKHNIKLSEAEQAAIDSLCKEPKAGSSAFGKPIIYKIFGDAPKVGAKATAIQVFERTNKGFAEMRGLMKKWDEHGWKVTYNTDKKEYTLDAGNVPEYKA